MSRNRCRSSSTTWPKARCSCLIVSMAVFWQSVEDAEVIIACRVLGRREPTYCRTEALGHLDLHQSYVLVAAAVVWLFSFRRSPFDWPPVTGRPGASGGWSQAARVAVHS